MWLLSVIPGTKDAMGWFTLGWAITIIAGVFGLAFIFRGLFGKNAGPLKKLNIYFGAGFVLVAVLSMIGELAIEDKQSLVIPIIAVVVTVALLLASSPSAERSGTRATTRTSATRTTISAKPKKKSLPKRTRTRSKSSAHHNISNAKSNREISVAFLRLCRRASATICFIYYKRFKRFSIPFFPKDNRRSRRKYPTNATECRNRIRAVRSPNNL